MCLYGRLGRFQDDEHGNYENGNFPEGLERFFRVGALLEFFFEPTWSVLEGSWAV